MILHQSLKILHRIHPNLLWNLYARKSKRILKSSYFILSFDCDTEDDIEVALEVHARLHDIGITPVYAVPGKLLKNGEKIYRKIFDTGAEFINHGGREHTYVDAQHKRHASCFFYDEQSFDVLREDILLGHQILQNVLGITAIGWRTPHFGTFQKPEHLNFLYSMLKELNYKFSTSTVPQAAYIYGPLYKKNCIFEIPVTGIFSEPFNILDTWGYFAAPDCNKNPRDYVKSVNRLAQFASKNPMLINIYGDPSHIYNQPEFFEAMKIIALTSHNITYSQFLEIAHENICTI